MTKTKAKRQATTAAIETGPSSTPGISPASTAPEAGMSPASTATATAPAPAPIPAPVRLTRLAQLRALLERPEGADLAELCSATGWQAHSVRAALSGLRKQGCLIERRPVERAEGDGAAEAASRGGFAYHLVIAASEAPDDAPGDSPAGEAA